MTQYNYSYKTEDKNIGKAVFRDVDISTKKAIEICSTIRYKPVEKAKKILQDIIDMKKPIKYTRFKEGAGHKKGKMGPAKYPVKAAETILKAVKSAESNANDKALSKSLKIVHISAQKASRPWHYGRQRRRKMKRTHIEIVVKEAVQKKEQKHELQEQKEAKETKKEAKGNELK